MKFLLVLKKLLKAKFFVGLFIVGLVFTIGGTLFVLHPVGNNYTATTTATITNIEETYDAATEIYEHEVTITYEVNGEEYTQTTGTYSSSWKEGSTIEVRYNPDDPREFSVGNSNVAPYIALGVGIAAIIVSLVKFVIIMKTPSEEMNEMNKVDMDKASSEEIEALKNNTEEQKQYHFYYTTGATQNYIMENADDLKHVYEAMNQHLSLFTKYEYRFINCATQTETTKMCGHTITSSYGGDGTSIDTDCYFTIDGVKCWEVLGKMGYSIEPHIKDLHVFFDVCKYGVKVATFEQTGTNVMTKKDYKLGNIPTPGIYNVSCRESDIEDIFLCCFVIARSYDFR